MMQNSNNISSMTAYASSQLQIPKIGNLSCEIKTVNSRFLDLNFRMPEYLNYLEPELRKLLNQNFKRGKIDFNCSLKFDSSLKADKLYTNQIQEYLNIYNNIKKMSQESGVETQDLVITDIMRELFNKDSGKSQTSLFQDSELKNDIENNLLELVNKTILNLLEQRKREGQGLKLELSSILQSIKMDVDKLETNLPKAMSELQDKFKVKIKDSITQFTAHLGHILESDAENGREQDIELKVAQDIVAYINKCDISEELARLKVHTDEVGNIINDGGVVGRKLDFLMQELTREANTLAAKSVDIDFRNIAVNLKVYVEQMREQIQNIE